ncbi:ABC-type multidrug/protein/lipid transport system ATPase component [Acholeplasma hippikon]|uniref:ABC-type multidrug/protein/lipid transport system ATPase component n=2 Tax=Acholeplasma hippikon TaxID=264636 RepID=A0A449BJ97_9MOLU|nr:ABC-type multidrug/protein/lipid transport system ATPase component [Acholeplasma hippikon]
MKFIFAKMGKYKVTVFFSLLLKTLGSFADLILPYLLAYLIDDVVLNVTKEEHKLVYVIGIIMLVVAVLGWGFNIYANRLAERVASSSVADVRAELFYKIERLDAIQVDKVTTTSLISRLTSDTYNIYSMIGSLQRLGIRAPMLLLGGIIIASFMDLTLTLVMVALLPFIFVIVYFYTKRGQPLYANIQKQVDNLIRTLRENITGVRVVRALSMTDHENKRFKEENTKTVKEELKATMTMNKIRPMIDIVMNIGLVVVLVLGAFRVSRGETKIGEILALTSYFTIILNAMSSITRIFIQTSRAQASANRIQEVLEMGTKLIDGTNEVFESDAPHIEFDDVTFSYHGKEAHLENINFKLYKGQTLGVLGATGSGKTTIINLLMRFYDPQIGQIKIFGEDIRTLKHEALRRHIGLVLQNDAVFSSSIRENIQFSRDMELEDVEFAKEIAQANFIDQIPEKFDYKVSQRGTNISGGQRQRLLIARAIAGKPKVLILDDASSALDYHTDRNLRKAINENLKDTTKIIVAQRISSIKDADLILVVEDGKIVAKGTHDELKKLSDYYKTLIVHQLGEEALWIRCQDHATNPEMMDHKYLKIKNKQLNVFGTTYLIIRND